MMIEYYAVVVLYNKRVQDSITISCLMKLKEEHLHIIVLDNSADDYVEKNKTYFSDSLVTYHSMGGNVGLSKAYNYALSILKNKSENDLVIWFDDDTLVKEEYFNCLKKKAGDEIYDVFAPVIYGQNGVIYSPNESGWLKGKYIQFPEQEIPQNKFNAINSCLAVRLKAYKDDVYDEGLFMDCVDTKLFDDFRKKGIRFCVLPVKVYQNFFQRSDNKDVQKYWKRFKIRIKDTLYYSSLNSFSGKLSGYIRIIGWSVVFGLKLKSPKFTLLCINQMMKVEGKSENNI